MKCPGSGQLTFAEPDAKGWQPCPACGQRVPLISAYAARPRLMTHNTNRRPTKPVADALAFGL